MAFNIFTDLDTHFTCDIHKIAKLIRKHRAAARMIGKQKKLLVSLAKRNAQIQRENNILRTELANTKNKSVPIIVELEHRLAEKDGEIKALKWALQNLQK